MTHTVTHTDAPMPTEAAACFLPLRREFSGRPVLLIGSGADLDGRKLAAAIDGGQFGPVARINRPYGATADVGTRANLVFVRRRLWLNWHFPLSSISPPPRIIAFREGVGCPAGYEREVAARLGLPRCSTGLLAAQWLLDVGAKVSAIGFGCRDGAFSPGKRYAVSGAEDANAAYDWAAENAWLQNNVRLL